MRIWTFVRREWIAALATVGVVACLLWLLRNVVIPLFTDPNFHQRF